MINGDQLQLYRVLYTTAFILITTLLTTWVLCLSIFYYA